MVPSHEALVLLPPGEPIPRSSAGAVWCESPCHNHLGAISHDLPRSPTISQACVTDPDLVFDFAVHLGAISHATHGEPLEWTATVMVRDTTRLLLDYYFGHIWMIVMSMDRSGGSITTPTRL